MELTALGFDRWFEERAGDVLRPGQSLARVTAVERGAFLVRGLQQEVPAELAGRFRFSAASAVDLPCVGDWVCLHHQTAGGPAIIHAVLPRKTFLRRKVPGKTVDFQMIAANIDAAFIVQSCHYDFNVRRLGRYLVMALDGGIQPLIVLTKCDLISPGELDQEIAAIRETGIAARIFTLSAVTGNGIDAFRSSLAPGRTYCLLGASDGREMSFPEIHELSRQCRFSDCTHAGEPGCAVAIALERGTLSEEGYRSYLKLRKESEHLGLSSVEKRKKDRAFGRFLKSAKKQTKK